MTTVAKEAKMEEDLERIILLILGKSKMIQVIHSCFVADRKIWGIHGTHVMSPIVDVPGQKACEKMLSMDSYPSMEGCPSFEETAAEMGTAFLQLMTTMADQSQKVMEYGRENKSVICIWTDNQKKLLSYLNTDGWEVTNPGMSQKMKQLVEDKAPQRLRNVVTDGHNKTSMVVCPNQHWPSSW
jgi:hypothetical protein